MNIARKLSFPLLGDSRKTECGASRSLPRFAVRATPFALLAFACLAMAGDSPRVSRSLIISTGKHLDERISRLWEDNPGSVMEPTRGVYLEGFGTVFIAEVSPVVNPQVLMNPILTPQDKIKYRQKKLERILQLKKALTEVLADNASSLDPLPANEQVVVAVTLTRWQWEDASGMPAQIVVQGEKRKLIDAKRTGGPSLDAAVRMTEY
jgi:hypothetical protein